MNATNMKTTSSKTRLLLAAMVAAALFARWRRHTPRLPASRGPTFNLTAQAGYITQPDGQSIYSWGYGCNGTPRGFCPGGHHHGSATRCRSGPTLIVTEGRRSRSP